MAESRELVDRAARGDRAAVEALLEEHLGGLRAYVRLHASPQLLAVESSSDLVQSTCLEILAHLDRFQHGGEANFRRWLYATALRKIQNRWKYHRAQRREAAREARVASRSDAALLQSYRSFCSPSQAAVAREQIERIERAFAGLAQDHRRVIVLAKIVELPRAEIAAEIGRSEAAVRTLLSRALSHLAEILAAQGSERPGAPSAAN